MDLQELAMGELFYFAFGDRGGFGGCVMEKAGSIWGACVSVCVCVWQAGGGALLKLRCYGGLLALLAVADGLSPR